MSETDAAPHSERVSETVDRHRELLEQAMAAGRDRAYWSAFPESPSPRVYGEHAAAEGERAFRELLGRRFDLDQVATTGWVGSEKSPYGLELDVTYPRPDLDALLPAMQAAMPAWRDAGPEVRAALCAEMLSRINARSFEIAHAVMHTSGQPFVMAFQAGGPHAQDRALEAIAYAYEEQLRYPPTALWEKPQGKRPPVRMQKTFTIVPRGIGLVIGCNTFPTWNSYPGLFASLVTGNAVLVKPHPLAVLPLAITVQVARAVLGEHGFAPDLVALVAEDEGERLAADLALRPEVGVVDFTGSRAFGDWLEEHARQAAVYTEKAGVNAVVLDSTDAYRGALANLAFSLSLYSGQMCTTPQNLFVPRAGIQTDEGAKSVAELAADLESALGDLLGDDTRAVELLGAIANDAVLRRTETAPSLGEVVVAARSVSHPVWPKARVRTPVVVEVDAGARDVYAVECFGPVAFLVTTDSSASSVELLRETVSTQGGLTAAIYSTDEKLLAAARDSALQAGVALSENLTDGVYVNQSAAFSDFHGTGANPAANASLTDGHFVSGRFHVVQSRRHLPLEATAG